MVHRIIRRAAIVAAASLALIVPATASAAGGNNDFGCRPSSAHPNPVVVLHGLGATYYEDLNFLQADLAARGYCTFSETYGEHDEFPWVGGLKPIATSAQEIRAFVERVRTATGAAKVDLVGHSEGGFQSLYVTKTQGIADRIGRVVAIAPPTHGTSFAHLVTLGRLFVSNAQFEQITGTLGVPAVGDLVTGGAAIRRLVDGQPIAQPGVDYTIITSRYDEMVTPTSTSFVHEPGVENRYVQDSCPFDPVGHLGEAYDLNVWHLVRNALDPANAQPIRLCAFGMPG